jgi:hypothetical protein
VHKRIRFLLKGRMTAPGVLVLALISTLGWSAVAPAAPTATVTGSFNDSCRDFEADSSKDISHVVIHYPDGRVVKDEDVDAPDFSIDGDAGDELDFVIVKSGTTTDQFGCQRPPADSPPTAVLERKAGKNDDQNPEGSWTSADCQHAPDTTFCAYGLGVGEPSVSFRGTSSTDPDDDIASWSIDFGGGTSTGGDWPMPAEVTQDYGQHGCLCTVVLTITDSAGHSSSDPMVVNIDNDGLD